MIKYIVIGDTAVLTTRDLVPLGDNITIQVEGIPTTCRARIRIYNASNQNQVKSFDLEEKSGKKEVTFTKEQFSFYDKNRIAISWWTPPATEGDEVLVKVVGGNDIAKISEGGIVGLMPRISARAVEIDELWRFVANAFTILLPVIEDIKDGNDVV